MRIFLATHKPDRLITSRMEIICLCFKPVCSYFKDHCYVNINAKIIYLDNLKALADFYQHGFTDAKSSDVEGTRLDSGDFIFYWDDGFTTRKMVRTSNTGEFIQSGFNSRIPIVGDNWQTFSLWKIGHYSIKNFRGSSECLKFFFLFQNTIDAMSL